MTHHMMTERTLSSLLRASILVVVLGFFLMKLAFTEAVIPGYIRYGYAIAFGAAPILLMMKVLSRFFLLGIKDQSLSMVEQMFMVLYVFLTKEARDEWRSYINEQKNKEVHS